MGKEATQELMDIHICLYGRLLSSERSQNSLEEAFQVIGGGTVKDGMCPRSMDRRILRTEGVGRKESHGR